MKKRRKIFVIGTNCLKLVFIALLYSPCVLFAQGKSISGTVTDNVGEPIIGASILLKGTTNGIITDLDGKFTLHNVPKNGIISISFIGFKECIERC
ncbi:carboxypeptidase-like regulatory domain-containing protein [Bacteroides reticulotermitis]|uniref:Uncharacterized protein n=1 Tax=Bacteroides reticulotermitis TaxID=1133319 RepID=A0A840D116_9BACE|nr:carboxypeptidase-like regulatory domain-containing protein [Bacteroides reticulotermitis]MBB4045780.1 hypothetical protein [Bacteroides reticulotermitis]